MRQQVAIVATDIVASSRLWEQHGATAPTVLDLHDRILRDSINRYSGYELRTEGDAFLVLFRDPLSAVLASLDAQQALARAVWPEPFSADNGLKVRVGIHLAMVQVEQDPVSGRLDVRGPALLRVARVVEAAHGGQILLSEPAARALRDLDEPTGIRLTALGRWLLSESETPEELFLVERSDARPAPRPPPRGRPAPLVPHNLPREGGPFFGRQVEAELLRQQILAPRRALLLHGLAGSGKSALALTVCHGLVSTDPNSTFKGGVWRVDLNGARTTGEAARLVAQTIQGAHERGATMVGVESGLKELGPALLLLDQADALGGLLDDLVGAWLAEAPHLQILALRRMPPSWEGWAATLLDPLPVQEPPARPLSDEELQALRVQPAVALLLHASSQVREDLGPLDTRVNLPVLARIARVLGGLPLALEIAASWLSVLSLRELEQRIRTDPFVVLSDRTGTPDLPARSIRRLLDETWVQLAPHTRAALTSLSVFQEGFTSLAASAVLDPVAMPAGSDASWALESLRARGLLLPLGDSLSGPRWSVAPLVSHGALILDADRAEEARARHGRFFAALAQEALNTDPVWRLATIAELLGDDIENLKGAMQWAIERQDHATRALIGRALAMLALLHGHHAQGLEWAIAAAAAPGHAEGVIAELLHLQGRLLERLGQSAESERRLFEAMTCATAAGDTELRARALRDLAALYLRSGRTEAAQSAIETALSLSQMVQDQLGEGAARMLRSEVHRRAGRWQQALDDHLVAHQRLVPLGLTAELAEQRLASAALMRDMNDTSAALDACAEAAEIRHALGDRVGRTAAEVLRARLLWEAARVEEASAALEGAWSIREALGQTGQDEEAWTLGLIRAELGQLEPARAALAIAEDEAMLANHPALLVPILLARAEVEMRLHGPGLARAWVERAERVAQRLATRSAPWLAIARGRRVLMLGDRVEASEAAQEARLLLDELPDPVADRLLRPLEHALWSSMALHSSSA